MENGIIKPMSWPMDSNNISSTIPSNDTSMSSGPSYEIPKEWEKANKALEEVLQKKQMNSPKGENSPVQRQQQPPVQQQQSPGNGVNFPPYPYWTPPQVYYPGYPNMGFPHPGYSYYNLNTPQFNSYYPMPPAMPMIPNPGMHMNNPNNISTNNEAVEKGNTSGVDPDNQLNQVSSSQESAVENNFRFNQAPGAGGIRFSLPKQKQKKVQQFRNFQNNFRQQKPLNNFAGRLSIFSPPKNEPNKLDSQKSGTKINGLDSTNFPPSLQKYIADSFAKCKTDLDKDLIEITLKGKLTKAVRDKELFTKDWSKEPLPTIHSSRENGDDGFIPLQINKNFNKMSFQQSINQRVKNEKMNNMPDEEEYIPLKIGSALKFKKNFNNKVSTNSSKHQMPINQRSRSSSRSLSRSRSRSSSPYPRRVVRRRRHSSDSTSSSNDNRKAKKTSPVNTPDQGSNKWLNRLGKKKNKKKKNKNVQQSTFTIDADLASDDRLQKRAARFEASGKRDPSLILTINNNSMPIDESSNIDWGSYAITGSNQEIEKSFFRLTGAVDPSSIRPVEVLRRALQNVKDHWIKNQDYHYACDQLKSIRQDLLVQCVRDGFTVQAYETHARIALEKGDHTEFNQCQSQLKVLYAEVKEGNRLEFTGYRILYNIFCQNSREIKNILSEMSPEEKRDEVIGHALALNRAWALNNFHQFFKLYRVAPKMSSFIIDWFIDRERLSALKIIIKSYRPTLPVAFVSKELGFESDTKCLEFLQGAKCLLSNDHSSILCKESITNVFITSS